MDKDAGKNVFPQEPVKKYTDRGYLEYFLLILPLKFSSYARVYQPGYSYAHHLFL
jgi:hypothetical protein